MCVRGEVKLQYLVLVPYIISRLGHEPNIRARCNEQVAQAPLSQHNRVTLEFFLPGCELNAAIAAMVSDYDLPHDGLRIAVQSLRDLVMLDVVNEGPHAKFGRIESHSSAASFAWKSSSCRLDQNLNDAIDIPSTDP